MYNSLLKLIRHPDLYETTDFPFWDDPYISSQMLKSHLNPKSDGATRNHAYVKESADWIQSKCPPEKYRKLLDLGCGPGIYCQQFFLSGYEVTGLDYSRRSINYAQAKAAEKNMTIDYCCASYLLMDIQAEFDLITLIYCDYGALSPENRLCLLKNAYRALKKGGSMIFDVFSLEKYNSSEEIITWESLETDGFWNKNKHVVLSKLNIKYPLNTLSDQYYVISHNHIKNYYLWNSCFTKDSLNSEIIEAGFKNPQFYSDITGKPFSEKSETIAVVLGK